jgi:hypothetical protein
MKHQSSIRIQIVAVAALALLAVPVAQAKDIALRSFQASSGETAQGVRADGLRLQALAKAYQASAAETAQGIKADGLRMQALANQYRENGAGANVSVASYPEDRQVAVQMRHDAQKLITSVGQPVQPVAHSFNWGDAGIGAGIAALATVLAALGAGGIVRKRSGAAHA